ncbi:MAG: hypothetical protein V3S29_10640, partial [bacterium]
LVIFCLRRPALKSGAKLFIKGMFLEIHVIDNKTYFAWVPPSKKPERGVWGDEFPQNVVFCFYHRPSFSAQDGADAAGGKTCRGDCCESPAGGPAPGSAGR